MKMNEMCEWTEYTGTDEQIAEMSNCRNGYLLRYAKGNDSPVLRIVHKYAEPNEITHYWIIPDDPLREMKIRQAQTGQPVWVRYKSHRFDWDISLGSVMVDDLKTEITTTPDWNMNAEYSFKHFED